MRNFRVAFCFAVALASTFALGGDESSPAPLTADKLWILTQQPSVCVTPVGSCYLPGYAPSGSPCWCATPYGPVNGRVR